MEGIELVAFQSAQRSDIIVLRLILEHWDVWHCWIICWGSEAHPSHWHATGSGDLLHYAGANVCWVCWIPTLRFFPSKSEFERIRWDFQNQQKTCFFALVSDPCGRFIRPAHPNTLGFSIKLYPSWVPSRPVLARCHGTSSTWRAAKN